MTFKNRALLIGAISLLSGCAAYTPPPGSQTVSVEYRNAGSTPVLFFDVFEDPKICGKRRPVKQLPDGRFAFEYPANTDLSFRLAFSAMEFAVMRQCELYVTFAAEAGYDFQIRSSDSNEACYVSVLKIDPSGRPSKVNARMRQSSYNKMGDLAKSWCEPET